MVGYGAWPYEGNITAIIKSRLIRCFFESWFLAFMIGIIGYVLYVNVIADNERLCLSEGPFLYAPSVGYVVTQISFILFGFWPLLIALRQNQKLTKTKKFYTK